MLTAGFIFLFLIVLILVTSYLCVSCGVQLYNEYLKEEIERLKEKKNEVQGNANKVSKLRHLYRQGQLWFTRDTSKDEI